MSNVLSLDQVVDTFSKDLEPWQREANFKWLQNIHDKLKEGGVLGIPNTQQMLIKCEDGFLEL